MTELTPQFPALDRILSAKIDADRWYVAFSGGLDSTVLLHLVNCWCRANASAPELIAWHVNHGMAEAASDWESHCAGICRDWGIGFRVDKVSVRPQGGGAEEAAREARYRVFEAGLVEQDILLMAHHRDDQVETFFLRLMRGSGLHGLTGIPRERCLGAGRLLRPLLDIDRSVLQDYAAQCGLSNIEDPSNRDTSLDRNFLRQEVLPLLARRWGGYRRTVSRASEHIASAVSMLEDFLPEPLTVYSALEDPGLPLASLTLHDRDVAAMYLRSWLQSRRLPAPGYALVDEFLRQLNQAAVDSSPRMDCGDYVLQRYGDAVYLLPEPHLRGAKSTLQLTPGLSSDVGGVGGLSLVPGAGEGFALTRGEVLEIRWRVGGERCTPRGRDHSRPLKKLLQEARVPPWWRDGIPLVYLAGELLAVADLWLCESSRLRQSPGAEEAIWNVRWERNTFAPAD